MKYIFLLLCCASCTHHYYAPNTVQTPYLTEQHDATILGGVGSGDEFSGSEIHAVYSPIKHVAVMFNYFNVKSKVSENAQTSVSASQQSGNGRLTEFALGGYLPFANGSASIFGGYGKGFAKNNYGADILTNLRFERTFIQPTIAFRYAWADVGMAIRINRLRYLDGTVDLRLSADHADEFEAIKAIEEKTTIVFPELGLSFGARYRLLMLKFHLSMLTDTSVESLHFARTYAGMSFGINIQDIKKSKND